MSQSPITTRVEFIEGLGIAAQEEGMSRISGRIMGLLMFDGGAFSFSDIASNLQVSRGSVSTNVRKLLDRGVIRKTSRPGDRQDYFIFAENPYQSLMSGVSARATATAHWLEKIAERLSSDDPERRQRVHDHAKFYSAIAAGFCPK